MAVRSPASAGSRPDRCQVPPDSVHEVPRGHSRCAKRRIRVWSRWRASASPCSPTPPPAHGRRDRRERHGADAAPGQGPRRLGAATAVVGPRPWSPSFRHFGVRTFTAGLDPEEQEWAFAGIGPPARFRRPEREPRPACRQRSRATAPPAGGSAPSPRSHLLGHVGQPVAGRSVERGFAHLKNWPDLAESFPPVAAPTVRPADSAQPPHSWRRRPRRSPGPRPRSRRG